MTKTILGFWEMTDLATVSTLTIYGKLTYKFNSKTSTCSREPLKNPAFRRSNVRKPIV